MASMTRELAFQAGIRPRENRAGAGGMTECGASYALENSRDKRLETTTSQDTHVVLVPAAKFGLNFETSIQSRMEGSKATSVPRRQAFGDIAGF